MSIFKFRKLPIGFGWVFLFGVVIAGLLALQVALPYLYYNEMKQVRWERLLPPLVNYTVWPFFVPFVYNAVVSYPMNEAPQRRNRFNTVAICLVLAFTHEVSTHVVYTIPAYLLGYEQLNIKLLESMFYYMPTAMISRILEFWIIYGALAAMAYYKQYRTKQIELVKLEGQLTAAQLKALRMQLQPHFLFNTLNTISSLVEGDARGARKVLSRLGNMLRIMLDEYKQQTIPLEKELEYIGSYLDIEQARFHDRLEVAITVAPEVKQASVPTLILQPLVENAIKHGFSKQAGSGRISIQAQANNHAGGQQLELVVADNGRGVADVAQLAHRPGIGLNNVRERLEQLYGNRHSFQVQSAIGQGFTVKISLPFTKHLSTSSTASANP